MVTTGVSAYLPSVFNPLFMRIALTFLMLVAGALPLAAQPASFVYRLGKDTLAIEQYTRTATSMNGEMVQRSGVAIARIQYSVTLGKDGRPTAATIKRLLADGSMAPNAPSETRIQVRADSIVREIVFADSVQRRAFAAKQALINFPVFIYGPTELLAGLRKGGLVDSIPALGFAGNLGFTGFSSTAADTVRLRGGAYAMALRFDANSRLMSLDGALTTNKVLATRGTGGLDMAAIAKSMKPTGALSLREVARGAFGPGGMVLIDYGRPSVRERSVWGGVLVPFDSVWRTGANDATHLFTTRVLTLGTPASGELLVPPGMYTLWVQHTRNGTSLIVSKHTGQWGTQYDVSRDLGRVPMTISATPTHVEEFTIMVRPLGANRGAVEMTWGPSMMSVPFSVSVAR